MCTVKPRNYKKTAEELKKIVEELKQELEATERRREPIRCKLEAACRRFDEMLAELPTWTPRKKLAALVRDTLSKWTKEDDELHELLDRVIRWFKRLIGGGEDWMPEEWFPDEDEA